jgi:outer membrane protein OmpA-like peptidoglycan-associated protein
MNIKLLLPLFISFFLFSVNAQTIQGNFDVVENNESLVDNSETPKSGVLTADFDFIISDTGVNSKQNEYGSGFFKKKYIIISAKKVGGLGGTKDPLTGEPHFQIYCATIKKTGDLDRPLGYSRILNTNDNEGSITFSPNQKTVYYTRSILGDKRNYKLFRAHDSEGRGNWANEEEIHFSSDLYSVENPYLSKDGKTLYFASDMPEGFGGFDLYSATLNDDGQIGIPVNLGANVNTAYNEKTPFIDEKSKYFYFSSNGHNSIGGLDIFRARNVKGNFVRTLNLGSSINTDKDDYAFMLANDQRGYVTSSKSNGVGGSDVYKLRINRNKQYIKGVVVDELTQNIISNANIQIIDIDGASVPLKTNKSGEFSTYVDSYEEYTVVTKKEGYIDNVLKVSTNSATLRFFQADVNMAQIKPEIVEVGGKSLIKIENIYFTFNKAIIKPDSKLSLDKIVAFLKENPLMKIKINAHTDVRGSANYNLALSKKRAKSTMDYLVFKGVDKSRLLSEGFGESQPVLDCESKVCTDEEHGVNRRIEFEIIK